MFEMASYEPFILMCREEKTSTSQLSRPIQCKNNVLPLSS